MKLGLIRALGRCWWRALAALLALGPNGTDEQAITQGAPDLRGPGSRRQDDLRESLAAGHQIQYIGASGPVVFNQYHNSFGSQAVEEFPASAPAVVVGTISQAAVQALHA